jgi:hypothetical protein
MDQDQAKNMAAVATDAASAVAARAVARAPKFQKFVTTVLDNAKDWTSGDRWHISDGETDISAEEIRTLLGGDLWDKVEEEVKEALTEEIRDEVRDEIEEEIRDEVRDEIRDEIVREVQVRVSDMVNDLNDL